MLHLHFSNRFEVLRDGLLQRLDEAPGGVFDAPTVIVPGAAVQRALTLAIADRHGVCANVEFAFLAQWLWRQIARLVPDVAEASPFAPGVLAWRVWDALVDPAFAADHPRLQGWLAQADAVMRWDLAQQVASLFDQYLTYRPQWLQSWERGRRVLEGDADEAWQAALWQRLAAGLRLRPAHPADAFLAALDRLGAQGPQALADHGLPTGVHLIALPAIPPLYLKLLAGMGRWTDLHLHVLNPCREYWFEIVDGRVLARLRAEGRDQGHEIGHRLLAGWGRQTQSQVALLIEAAGESLVDDGAFVEAARPTLLARLQDSLLDLQQPVPGAWPLAEDDRSLEVHVAHSRLRELEVLQDRLLARFAADPTLRPGDVLVVTPDLDATAPLVEAVFGTVPAERALPFSISGRSRSRLNPLAQALLGVLALAGARCTVTEVTGLLAQPPVARRFGLDDEALAQLGDALNAAGVHWGLDGAQRQALGLGDAGAHSFEDGLDRLLLGHALPGDRPPSAPLAGRLPVGDIEGRRALPLGALWQLVQRLQGLQVLAGTALPAGAWPARLAALVDDFVEASADEADDARELQAAIAALGDTLRAADPAAPLPLAVLREALARQLDDPARGATPTGAITFTGMTPLRGLPYRIVCVIGLDDGAFPGRQRPPEFDLMARQPREGDRQRRLDERNLFLDLVLAAREQLHLSHTGRSARDNQPLPPSVLVDELLEFVLPAVTTPVMDEAAARRRLVVEHPLQPFALESFLAGSDPRQRSHAEELAQALRRALGSPPANEAIAPTAVEDDPDLEDDRDDAPQAPFFIRPLPPPDGDWRQPTLARLIEFFSHPARALLKHRLQVDLPRPAEALDDCEPFTPDGLSVYGLGQRLLPALLEGRAPAGVEALAEAGTELPAGPLGRQRRAQALTGLHDLAQRLRPVLADAPLPTRPVVLDLDLGGEAWRLHGHLAGLRPQGLVQWRAGAIRAQERLRAWLSHLLLCAAAPADAAPRTRMLALDGGFDLTPVPDAPQRLRELLALYREGLGTPLHFFPKTAWTWWTCDRQPGPTRRAWHGSAGRGGEGDDPAWRLALRGMADPLDEHFARCAEAVYGPLSQHLQEPGR
ncbi:exodeoxyribonuclease V subunit gamma [Aquabacterium sp. J223]|uniref:exodeoxyribonuclease V subunit gamma n=1 Tax=Aquabacterium sp. J223 TaxID=2898431 RepID=UPI0021AD7E89|nr:exodeoxyribonuclease V subunit gamma [Aquabacterium sp. J223]UUX94247.1 exodeoxyribonuclease V subunit gamma [Aquabacterium sp. J223]